MTFELVPKGIRFRCTQKETLLRLKVRLTSWGSIDLFLARCGEVLTRFAFLLVLGVSVDQFARHLGDWEGLMEGGIAKLW